MKYAAIAFLAVLALPSFVLANDRDDLPKACALEWPNDFVMQEHCVKKQNAAAMRLNEITQEISRTDDTSAKVSLVLCSDKWQNKRGGMDFVMVEHCLKKQLSARARLRSSSSASR